MITCEPLCPIMGRSQPYLPHKKGTGRFWQFFEVLLENERRSR